MAVALPNGATVTLGGVIGRGGSGVVHRGVLHGRGGDQEVALKMLGVGSTDRQQRSFLREIEKSQIISSRCDGVVDKGLERSGVHLSPRGIFVRNPSPPVWRPLATRRLLQGFETRG
jgi:hypothetical protein